MAICYTELTGKETPGEKTVYNTLQSRLDDDYMMWHNVIIPGLNREIDFIILNPSYGIWVIEVKDWLIDQIQSVEVQKIKLKKRFGTKSVQNPIYQARNCWIHLKEKLGKIDVLTHQDGEHQGNLLMPINYLVIFTNITAPELIEKELEETFFSDITITRNMIESQVDDSEWQSQFNNKRTIRFVVNNGLNIEQINSIKRAIGTIDVDVRDASATEPVGTLDYMQQRLIKWRIDGQAVIEGPAGSGKSIVLIKRALYIKQKHPDWDIGIICFNAVMANYLRILFRHEDIEGNSFDIYDVFDWCSTNLPEIKSFYGQSENPTEALHRALYDNNVRKKYDAILIDEGQDTNGTYLTLYRKMLKSEESSFTIFYDLKQTLYTEKNIIDLMKKNGFDVPKERRLVKQQRSVIIATAITYFEKYNNPDESVEEIFKNVLSILNEMFSDPLGVLVRGVTSGFKSLLQLFSDSKNDLKKQLNKAVKMEKFESIDQMVQVYVEEIKSNIKNSEMSYGDFLFLYPSRKISVSDSEELIAPVIQEQLDSEDIPYELIDSYYEDGERFDNRRTADLQDNVVRVMTIHASKGFDANNTFICGFDAIDSRKKDHPAELGYVALTRAKKKCYIGYFQESISTAHLIDTVNYMKDVN